MYVLRKFDACDRCWEYINCFKTFSEAREARERMERMYDGNYKIEYEER